MPYFHATWRENIPSIHRYGLGGAVPDRRNFEDATAGVYLAESPTVAVYFLLEAYTLRGDPDSKPAERVEAIVVLVVDDARVQASKLVSDPQNPRRDEGMRTWVYGGIVDVTGMPIVPMDAAMSLGAA
jgi:hypothetical protein